MQLSSRLTAAMVGLVLLVAVAVGALTYRSVETALLPGAFDDVAMHVRLVAAELKAHVRNARADAAAFRAGGNVRAIVGASAGGLDSADSANLEASQDRLAGGFAAALAAKPDYLRLRLIALKVGAREVVRVERGRGGDTIRRATPSELRDLADDDYVRAARGLPPDVVYLSAVEFEESGSGAARVPILHVTGSVQEADGRRFGLVVIDLDLRPAFTAAQSAGTAGRQTFVLDEKGELLVQPDPGGSGGLHSSHPADIPVHIAELARAPAPTGAQLVRDAEGNRLVTAVAAVPLTDGPRITVAATMPYDAVVAPAAAGRRSVLFASLAAVLVAVALAAIISRSLVRPLAQMTAAIEGFGRTGAAAIPVDAGGEIGVLAGAFARMTAEVKDKRAALEHEIEEHRRTETALAASEAKFRALFANTPLPIWAYDRETLYFVEANEATFAKYGYSRAEVESMRATDLRPPEDVPRFLGSHSVAARPARHAGDWRHRLRSGRIIDVEVTAHDMELGGRPVTVAVVTDITERKRSQQALLESEQMARGIIDSALDAFVQADEAGLIVEWNAQAETVFGWSRQDALGQSFDDLMLPPQTRLRYTGARERFIKTGEWAILGRRLETEFLCRGGGTVKVELAITALRRRSGYVFNAFIRDLTEKVAAEEQLRQAQKLESVGKLTGGIAHDFNNILTVITGTIDILAAAVAPDPKLATIAKMIDDAAERGAELTRRLLAFARKQPLQPRMTDINGLVLDAAKMLRPTLGETVEIETVQDEALWPALVDPTQLTTALVNLALNARDAMLAGGKLMLQTDNMVLDEAYAAANAEVRPGRYVMIVVSDTGAGIPAAIRDKVFEPFFTTKDVGKGTGLGLSMVYGFVRQSGGHVKIYSEEGHGTAVRLFLPAADEHADRREEPPPSLPMAVGREAILVVEDDALVRSYVITQLRSLGYATEAASDATSALQLIDSGRRFDLLFTDVIMPGGMNGRQLAEAVRARRPSIRVLYTSGYTENVVVHQGRLDPSVALLTKPYRKVDLARRIRDVLDTPAEQPSAS
jgi:PAS domain S-box-containing protein